MDKLGHLSGIEPGTNGAPSGLAASMKEAGIDYSVNLPVMTSVKQAGSVNEKMIQAKEELEKEGILTFGGLHPDMENYREELKKLADAGISGIKLHPAYQAVDVDDIRMERIIDAASELGLIVLIHAGIDIGIYDRNYASVAQILNVIRDVQPEKFVLAHMGGWPAGRTWNGIWPVHRYGWTLPLPSGPSRPTTKRLPALQPHYQADEDFLRLAASTERTGFFSPRTAPGRSSPGM